MMAVAAFAACLFAPCATVAQSAPHYRVTGSIAGADGGWDFAALDAAHGQLYIARSNAISVADLASGSPLRRLIEARRAHQVLVLDAGATLFATDGETGLGRFITAADGKQVAEVATGTKPDAALFDPVTGRIAVMNPGNDTVALIDPVARKLITSFKLAGGLEFAVADGKGGAFINLEDAGAIAHVDLAAARVLGHWALPGCTGPTGLALVAHGTRLISACANGVAVVVDAATGRLVSRLAIGRDPDAVLVDEARQLAFIPCGASGTLVALSLADPDHIAIAQTITTRIGAKTGALDPRTGRLYLPTATLSPPAPGAKRGKPVPGSFVVLVVAPDA